MSEQMTIERVVPKLRFSGFETNIKECLFKDIYTFYSTNSLSREKLNYENGIVKNIHYGDIHKNFKTIFNINNEIVPFINNEVDLSKIKQENYCQEGDLVIADASEDYNDIGKTIELLRLNNEKVLAGLHTFLARPNKNKIYIGFPSYLLQSWNVRKQIMIIAQGTKVLSISTGRLGKVKLSVPSLPEQQKIATFLTAVDDKIQALTKKQNLLEQYKKGVMQKIFSQELRFKDENGNDFADWEEKKLGEFLENKSVRNKNLDYDLILSVSNSKGFILQTEQFDNHRVASKNVSNYKIVKKYDIAYNPSRINVGSIAILKNYECGIVSPMYIVFALKKGMNLMFFENLIETHLFKHLVIVGCSGSVRDSLNFDDLGSFKFSIPSISEQAKIANYLNSIDKKINQVNNQLDKAKQFKKGLLQQMFV